MNDRRHGRNPADIAPITMVSVLLLLEGAGLLYLLQIGRCFQ